MRFQILIIGSLALLAQTSAAMDLREQTLEVLGSIESSSRAASPKASVLQARVNQGIFEQHRVGEEISYYVKAQRDGYLTVISVDSHGVGALIVPSGMVSDGRLEANVEKSLPDARFYLEVAPPLGASTVVFIETSIDISSSLSRDLFVPDNILPLEPERTLELVKDLQNRIRKLPAGSLAVWRIDHRIAARSAEGEYIVSDVVNFFEKRSRTLARPTLDSHILFGFDSAEIMPETIDDLAVFCEAFDHPRLISHRFLIGGHSDNVGPSEYNLALSGRRARAVRDHLVDGCGIASRRLETHGHGDAKPLASNTTLLGRKENRRVDFQFIRD